MMKVDKTFGGQEFIWQPNLGFWWARYGARVVLVFPPENLTEEQKRTWGNWAVVPLGHSAKQSCHSSTEAQAFRDAVELLRHREPWVTT